MHQNNFTNNYLQTISEQTTRIEEKLGSKNNEKDKILPEIEKSFIKTTRIEPETTLKKEPLKNPRR